MTAQRRNIMLGTAGHVDHGKTALVKMLTGCDTDTLAEEKQRGLTIDLGFAPCRLAGNRVVGVVDVPGHVDFIRNMVAGAHGIDVVILVVAADDGIMPQTHEHLHILTLMGLRHGLVALTKTDLVPPDRLQEVTDKLRGLLAGTFLAAAPICPLSNITGEGYEQFFEALNNVVDLCEDRPCTGLFRVWVEDVFTIRGSGTVITGIPVSGRVALEDRLSLAPGGASGRVRRMQVYGEEATEARAGECVAMNLPEIDHETVRRGQLLCGADVLRPVTMLEAELQTLGTLKSALKDSAEVHLHLGTATVLARVAMLEASEMAGSQTQKVQFRLEGPLAAAAGDRFVIRANLGGGEGTGLTTIGGGRVLGTGNVRLRRRKPWTLEALAARSAALGDPVRWCALMIRESATPVTAVELEEKCLLRPEEVTAVLDQARAQGQILPAPGRAWVHRESVEKAASALLAGLQAFHAAHPQRAGAAREELLAGVAGHVVVKELAVEELIKAGKITGNGAVLAQAGWAPRVTDRDQELGDRIAETMQKAGWAPPGAEELAASLGELPPRVERMLRLLTERGVLVRLEERLLMHREAIESAKAVVMRLFAATPSFTTMQFRDAVGVSRKYAVPLLDYLDRARFTVRSGHTRTPGAEAKKRASKL
jgi:selenocysteine-specific elongation factor